MAISGIDRLRECRKNSLKGIDVGIRSIILAAATILFVLSAQAAPVSTLSLATGQTVHVTLYATSPANYPLMPADITVSPLGSPAIASVTPDTTAPAGGFVGFSITGVAVGTATMTTVYACQAGESCEGGTLTGSLPITITAAPVTLTGPIIYTSP